MALVADVQSLDEAILHVAHGAPAWAVPVFYVFTVIGAGWGLAGLVPFLVQRNSRRATLWCIGAIVATSLVTTLLKQLVGRPRPCNALGWCGALVAVPDGPSFPSGHASGSFAFAAFVAARHPKYAPLVILYAMLVAWSRCVLGVHYPSDVLAGSLLGATIGALFALWLRRLERDERVKLPPAS